MRKIPPDDAFRYYSGLGPGRNYQMVADRFHVARRSVVRAATKSKWQERLQATEKEARQSAEKKMAESLGGITARQLKVVRLIQAKSLQALRDLPTMPALDAVRALDLVFREERGVAGKA